MKLRKFSAIILAIAAVGYAAPASAQATRTWVSGVGDDVNPCSRTAPCKTFAGAISKTAAGGEINCLDPGGFGTLTITKSITVDCSGTFGSALNSGGIHGFIINDSATATPGSIRVILRGLNINGAGSTQGQNGVRFVSGGSLVLENLIIQNQGSGSGISAQPSGNAEFYAQNVTIADSGSSSGAGILLQVGPAASLKAVLRDVRVHNSAQAGLRIDTTGNNGAGISVLVDDSSFAGGSGGIVVNGPAGAGAATLILKDSVIANNAGTGISAVGERARVRLVDTVVHGNGTGLSSTGGGTVSGDQASRPEGNGTDGDFTPQ